MYKPILNTFVGLILSVAADVPSLINYQGRLVDGVGNPVTGSKAFKLDIYDSQTEGTLIYQETLPDITLDEDGAYSFQFGAGVSRTGTSQLIATGDGDTMLFQTRLEQTPFGPITVTDGTNTFTQGDVATGEEPFTFLYVRGLNRINLVCNEPPAAGVKFTATYRYNEAGIVGALGTAAEHWMEVTIGGEKQEPRQRLVAVPFALRAGVANRLKGSGDLTSELINSNTPYHAPIKSYIKTIKGIRFQTSGGSRPILKIRSLPKPDYNFDSSIDAYEKMDEVFSYTLDESQKITELRDLNIVLDHKENYYFIYRRFFSGASIGNLGTYEIFFTK